MTEVEAIRQRHSVRSYLDKKIEPETARLLCQMISECNEKGHLHLQFLPEAGGTFHRLLPRAAGLASAPSVIACAGPADASLEERIGYFGEKVVLYAQQLALNTCWCGTFSARNTPVTLAPGEKMPIVIAVGYGADQGRPRRSKTMAQVAGSDGYPPPWFRDGVALALLAPTAINQQKFHFRLCSDGSVLSECGPGPFSRIDLGIARCHFDAALRAVGMKELWGEGGAGSPPSPSGAPISPG